MSVIRTRQPVTENVKSGLRINNKKTKTMSVGEQMDFYVDGHKLKSGTPLLISRQLCHQGPLQARLRDNSTDSGCVMCDGEGGSGTGFLTVGI